MLLALFYLVLIFLVIFTAIKYFGISPFAHRSISNIISEQEKKIHQIAKNGKTLARKIHFKNAHRIAVATIDFVKKESMHLKRKFDSQQPKFFLMQTKQGSNQKHAVSFFLKTVSEHKDSIKKKDL